MKTESRPKKKLVNDIKVYRRHMPGKCKRYRLDDIHRDTFKPNGRDEIALDIMCADSCPLYAQGYLRYEMRKEEGKKHLQRPLRFSLSIDPKGDVVREWKLARTKADDYEKLGRVPTDDLPEEEIVQTVQQAVDRYLTSRRAENPPITEDTMRQWEVLLELRLLPFCKDKGWQFLEKFEHKDNCLLFKESWVILDSKFGPKRDPSEPPKKLGPGTEGRQQGCFRTFLDDCVERGWIKRNGAASLKKMTRHRHGQARKFNIAAGTPTNLYGLGKRFGLEHDEYARLLSCVFELPYCETNYGKAAYLRINTLKNKYGFGAERIAKLLNEEATIPTKWGPTRTWNASTVRSILLNTIVQTKLPDLAYQETYAAIELMRWTGMRISDCHTFSEHFDTPASSYPAGIVPSEDRDSGWPEACQFVQHKTDQWCTVPLPTHVRALLDKLPGRIGHMITPPKKHKDEPPSPQVFEADPNGVKYFFTSTYAELEHRIMRAVELAQRIKPFKHHFSVHCLRHTFVIQMMMNGVPMATIARWVGHSTSITTIQQYGNPIASTIMQEGVTNRTVIEDMMRKVDASKTLPIAIKKVLPEEQREVVLDPVVPKVPDGRNRWLESEAGKAHLVRIQENSHKPEALKKNAESNSSVTLPEAAIIRKRHKRGEDPKALQAEYKISVNTFKSIVKKVGAYKIA
jgi:hypothetical protein